MATQFADDGGSAKSSFVILDLEVDADSLLSSSPSSLSPCLLCCCARHMMMVDRKKTNNKEESNCKSISKKEEISLYRDHEIPDFLRINRHIVRGYRSLLPVHLCLKSLFIWSNETINIWSHLLGCLIFVVLLMYDNVYAIPKISGSFMDHIICSISLICFQICMISSASYHVFYCHSPKANIRWLAIDLSGIIFGLMGCYIPGVHYSFYCLVEWERIYMIIIVILSVIILSIQLKPKRLNNSLTFTMSRVLMYSCLAIYGIIPAAHWIYLNGGWENKVVQVFVPKIVVMYLIGVGAVFFYLSQVPERLAPGIFDIVGASHQIWHIFIFSSLVWWRKSYMELLDYRMQYPCVHKAST
ncbi:progestin and adipoQ receptor family member 3-like [Octopus vulgaris]|uniref:Progestin and adipoQ receptor family member 3-like n=2 Tax=Octopus TaxID=6643 RepID=A0AA36FHN2_OCTVU|nr:progestin and adipoQ receptor family member 3-like [Octopus sinensis]XP_036368230.1 progestin and adipoQ receptor family member 3-like [Octopus sinensis]CAI9739416.1 progestin and adipoQ receptor family member 3-like [Octopus vulgaris]